MKYCYQSEKTAMSVLCYRDKDGMKELWLMDRGNSVHKSRRFKIMKGILTFYHGTSEHGLKNTNKQGYLLHERKSDIMPNASPCTYLATDFKEAKQYGDIILKVKYNPFKNPQMNNYCKGCWQVRVYEPIYNYEVINN